MRLLFTILVLICGCLSSCKKVLDIATPGNLIPASEAFKNEEVANKAIAGIYRQWRSIYNSYYSPTIIAGLSADELVNFSVDLNFKQFSDNEVLPTNAYLPWSGLYNMIYQANAAIEGLGGESDIAEHKKKYYLGEAKFLRAYSYFVLVNFFGDVPLLLTTDVKYNQIAARTNKDSVYSQIILDLKDAALLMETDLFNVDYKFRVNRYCAYSLLSRVLLYTQQWAAAEEYSTKVIEANRYILHQDLDSVFLQQSKEAIFQFDNGASEANIEARVFIFEAAPIVAFSIDFVNSFEPADKRKSDWVSSKQYLGNQYYFPFKYKTYNFSADEYYTLLRLSEQYLIRAEARIKSNSTDGAINDINAIRVRAGVNQVDNSITSDSIFNLIQTERRHELFAETPHRWFDLKRTGKASQVLPIIKGNLWQSSDMLYPIPSGDISKNPNLTQNP